MDTSRPSRPWRRSRTVSTTTSRTTRSHHTVCAGDRRLAFLLNCARTSQQMTNPAHSQPTIEGAFSTPVPLSVPEVVELQGQIQLRAAQQLDRRLQVIPLLARDADFLSLDTGLHLELRVLDDAGDLLSRLRIDALLQDDLLAGGGECGLGVFEVEAGEVDAALAEAQLQDLEHLLQLKVHLRVQGHGRFLELEARPGILEIETLGQLSVGLVDGVGHFVGVELGNYVERRHGTVL